LACPVKKALPIVLPGEACETRVKPSQSRSKQVKVPGGTGLHKSYRGFGKKGSFIFRGASRSAGSPVAAFGVPPNASDPSFGQTPNGITWNARPSEPILPMLSKTPQPKSTQPAQISNRFQAFQTEI